MESATSLKQIRAISAVTAAEAAPTTATTFVGLGDVGGHFFGKARAIFGVPTLGNADNVASVQIWAREGDTIVPLALVDKDAGTDLFPATDLGVCPTSWSFYATVPEAVTGTSAELTVTVYVQRYTDAE